MFDFPSHSTLHTQMRLFKTLKFLLDFPSSKLENDPPLLLKRLNYPFKLSKSTLRSPTPSPMANIPRSHPLPRPNRQIPHPPLFIP